MVTLRQNPPFVSCRMVSMSPVDDEPRPQAGRRRRFPARTTGLAATLASVVLLAPLVSAAQVEWPPDRRVLRTFDEEHWPPGQQFLGSQICQGCHPTVWKGFPGNPHFKSVAQGGRPVSRYAESWPGVWDYGFAEEDFWVGESRDGDGWGFLGTLRTSGAYQLSWSWAWCWRRPPLGVAQECEADVPD